MDESMLDLLCDTGEVHVLHEIRLKLNISGEAYLARTSRAFNLQGVTIVLVESLQTENEFPVHTMCVRSPAHDSTIKNEGAIHMGPRQLEFPPNYSFSQ